MYTVIKGAAALAWTWQNEVEWIPFHHLVKEQGTDRSFARFPSEETAQAAATSTGGKLAEVLVNPKTGHFEITLYDPAKQARTVTASGR